MFGKWFGHERCVTSLIERNFFDDMSKSHDVICCTQRIGISKIDFLLAGRAFVMAKFDGNSHSFEQSDCLATEIMSHCSRSVIKISTRINRSWFYARNWLILK
jgi:hypothetical protein